MGGSAADDQQGDDRDQASDRRGKRDGERRGGRGGRGGAGGAGGARSGGMMRPRSDTVDAKPAHEVEVIRKAPLGGAVDVTPVQPTEPAAE